MFWILTTLFPCLMSSAIILSWSLLLLSQPSPQCVMAVQLSLRWFSFHGLFPVSRSKSLGKRGIQCLCRVSAAHDEPFEVLTVHEMQHMRGLVCSTDDWLYVYIHCIIQYLTDALCLSLLQTCYNASWLTVYANKRSKPHIGLDAQFKMNHYNPPPPRSQDYCVRVNSDALWELLQNTFPNKQQPIKVFHLIVR